MPASWPSPEVPTSTAVVPEAQPTTGSPLPTSALPGHSLHHGSGFHGAQGVIHRDQVTATFITGGNIEAAEGEAQHRVSVPPQRPLAAGVRWVGAVGEAGCAEAGGLAALGVQGKAAAVCVGQEDTGQNWELGTNSDNQIILFSFISVMSNLYIFHKTPQIQVGTGTACR